MKKIPTLFQRNRTGNYLVTNKVTSGCEWVIKGEGFPTVKVDGTCCMIERGILYKRYDRKPTKRAKRKHQEGTPYEEYDLKEAPFGWTPAQPTHDPVTGHFPGWLKVNFDDPTNHHHKEAWLHKIDSISALTTYVSKWEDDMNAPAPYDVQDGTYELIGPKVQGNPYNETKHLLVKHGEQWFDDTPPRTYDELHLWFSTIQEEGIVWHHPNGMMCKIKRSDFGYDWPIKSGVLIVPKQ